MLTDERPENELHEQRAAEALTIVALVFERTKGAPGAGSIACPLCKVGTLDYAVTLRHGDGSRRVLVATCSSPGCFKLASTSRPVR